MAVFAFDRAAWRTRHLRMFAPEVGVVEDPATGSAAVALGGVPRRPRGWPRTGRAGFTVAQGAEIGRPSRLEVLVHAAGGAAVRTAVHGAVAAVARGELVALPSGAAATWVRNQSPGRAGPAAPCQHRRTPRRPR